MHKIIYYGIPKFLRKRFKEYVKNGVFVFPHRISLPSDTNYTHKRKAFARIDKEDVMPLEMPNCNEIKAYDLINFLEDKFYDEFYLFVDMQHEVGYRYAAAIKEYMSRHDISEDDIKMETLIKSHYRYRTAKKNMILNAN